MIPEQISQVIRTWGTIPDAGGMDHGTIGVIGRLVKEKQPGVGLRLSWVRYPFAQRALDLLAIGGGPGAMKRPTCMRRSYSERKPSEWHGHLDRLTSLKDFGLPPMRQDATVVVDAP
jgi:hypothetical protein